MVLEELALLSWKASTIIGTPLPSLLTPSVLYISSRFGVHPRNEPEILAVCLCRFIPISQHCTVRDRRSSDARGCNVVRPLTAVMQWKHTGPSGPVRQSRPIDLFHTTGKWPPSRTALSRKSTDTGRFVFPVVSLPGLHSCVLNLNSTGSKSVIDAVCRISNFIASLFRRMEQQHDKRQFYIHSQKKTCHHIFD